MRSSSHPGDLWQEGRRQHLHSIKSDTDGGHCGFLSPLANKSEVALIVLVMAFGGWGGERVELDRM